MVIMLALGKGADTPSGEEIVFQEPGRNGAGVTDVTPLVETLRERPAEDRVADLPSESPYPLPAEVAAVVGAS